MIITPLIFMKNIRNVSTVAREPRNYEFATIQRIMIVGKGQNMRCFSRFEWKFGSRWGIEFNLILERKELVAYPFNDIWRIVKRYGSGVLLFKKKVTYFSFTRHIYIIRGCLR